jgi:hypothetical protein
VFYTLARYRSVQIIGLCFGAAAAITSFYRNLRPARQGCACGELGFMDRWCAQKPGKRRNIHSGKNKGAIGLRRVTGESPD